MLLTATDTLDVRSWNWLGIGLMARIWLVLVLPVLTVPASVAQVLPTETRPSGAASASSPTSAEILTAAAASLARHQSVVASMRQRIDLYGRRLVGSGSYRQLQTGTDLLFRLELKVPVGETLASLLQVCDGRYLWTYRVLPDKQVEKGLDASLSAVDLNRVREMSFVPRVGTANFGLGGLPGLLNQTARVYRFSDRSAKRSARHFHLDSERKAPRRSLAAT